MQWIFVTILAVQQELKVNSTEEDDSPDLIITIILFISTIWNGLTVGILWACANNYVARCSSVKSRGFYFSYFWTFYMASQIIGNFIAAYTLGYLTQTAYFLIMGFICLIGTVFFWYLGTPVIIQGNE